ncbi:MAG: L-asparaginase [Mycobacterium sp.]|jgi:L-asparaginase|nr:L-asparaginase [Mycobacterium sp.]MDT5133748.1 L-asparaginase [Mycobacterium sp.]
MARPRVAAASLGGTITMTSTTADGQGARPTLSAEQLLTAVPALDDSAELSATTLNTMPGASLTFDAVVGALNWACAEVSGGAAGAVVIQGTDTIEETAYLLDLYWDQPAPLVVTGAMRPPQTPGADGPANLVASVRVAADDASRQRGVLVVLNDEIHAARRARKVRASGPDAFASPSFGPLGYVDERRPVYGTTAADRRTLRLPDPFITPRVALLETFLGDDGEVLDVISSSGFHGVVVAGFGVGHASTSLAGVVEKAASSLPVVLASRTGAGSTHRNSYSFDGSESDLIARGAIPAGWLDARKARVLLACLLADGAGRDDIRSEFDHRSSTL